MHRRLSRAAIVALAGAAVATAACDDGSVSQFYGAPPIEEDGSAEAPGRFTSDAASGADGSDSGGATDAASDAVDE